MPVLLILMPSCLTEKKINTEYTVALHKVLLAPKEAKKMLKGSKFYERKATNECARSLLSHGKSPNENETEQCSHGITQLCTSSQKKGKIKFKQKKKTTKTIRT